MVRAEGFVDGQGCSGGEAGGAGDDYYTRGWHVWLQGAVSLPLCSCNGAPTMTLQLP